MKILFFTRLFYPHIGGVEKHVWEIAERLVKKGYAITIVTELHKRGLKEYEKINGFEIFRMSVGEDDWFKKFRAWIWLLNHRSLIEKADIIHCHDVFFWYFPFKFFNWNKPVYTTFHGYESYPVRLHAVVIRKFSEILSNGTICIGNFMKKWYKANPELVSYGGVEIDDKVKSINKTKSAVFIGRLDIQTSIMTYVKCFEILKNKISKFKFTVVGDGILRKKISNLTKVIGFKNNSLPYLEKHHFAFVSRNLSILEALQAKRLVFAVYDNPLKEDYLRMTPFAEYIVIAGSAQELVDKVIYYLNHPDEEKKLVEAGYKWVKTQTWDKVVDLYEKLWGI